MKNFMIRLNLHRNAKKLRDVQPSLTFGQSVMNAAIDMYPGVAMSLLNTEVDPFHHDERVSLFIDRLIDLLNKIK